MPSFDAVSELNGHEVANAVDQANRELSQRFDFKDTGATFELKEFVVTLRAQVDFQLKQMLEILKLRLSKRGVDLVCLEVKDPQTTLATAQQEAERISGARNLSGSAAINFSSSAPTCELWVFSYADASEDIASSIGFSSSVTSCRLPRLRLRSTATRHAIRASHVFGSSTAPSLWL